jgi:DNA-binding ferritin-like protein
MNNPIQTPEELAGNRIDESAERIKQATSNAVASTKEAVERAPDRP